MKVGFIGLGIMGKPMARNLMKAGHQLSVYDLVPGIAAEIAADGAIQGESAKDVAAGSEVTITMVPDGLVVEAAVLGSSGALEGARPGTIIVDMSSISPMVAQRVGAALQRGAMAKPRVGRAFCGLPWEQTQPLGLPWEG